MSNKLPVPRRPESDVDRVVRLLTHGNPYGRIAVGKLADGDKSTVADRLRRVGIKLEVKS